MRLLSCITFTSTTQINSAQMIICAHFKNDTEMAITGCRCQGFIGKPFDIGEIDSCIRSLLEEQI